MKLRNSVIAIAAVAMAATIQTAQAAFTDNLADLNDEFRISFHFLEPAVEIGRRAD